MAVKPSIQSMTAFGTAEVQHDHSTYVCEVKSLNSRYLEVNIRLPRFLMALETELIAVVKKTLARGKVEVNFNIQLANSLAELPKLNSQALDHYLEIYQTIRQQVVDTLGNGVDVRPVGVSDFYRLEGVLESQTRFESSSDLSAKHRQPMHDCLRAALANLIVERSKEGAALHGAFVELVKELETERSAIARKAAEINAHIYTNYLKRLEALANKMSDDGVASVRDLPEDRLVTEVSIMADKCDIDEELTRLKAHIDEFNVCLATKDPIGRKMDFVCQEMHREINTMSNKLVQTEATKHTLNLKQLVEKVRQQVQNIE